MPTLTDRRVGRRSFLAAAAAAAAAGASSAGGSVLLSAPFATAEDGTGSPAFAERGYYITFMRMPTYGLDAWKRTVDSFEAVERINLLVLWMAGGFRSKKFPETWRYNAEHVNVKENFAADLIRHAQGKGIKVLLGFTPFGYDGVNQYTLDRPELRAVKRSGGPTDAFGIHCWGWNLCPSKPQSQRFMLDYAREMCSDFYPDADGVLIESSDYAICHCADCGPRFYDREFQFVRQFSAGLWDAKPRAKVVVYPHYFSGAQVPGMGVAAARQEFDPRWTLFFTPHSAHVDERLAARARSTLWSDDAPALHGPAAIRGRARQAREAKLTGCVPSLEAFTYVPTHVEEGRQDLVGKRQAPFGFAWLAPGEMPYDELPARVNRLAFREYSNDPDLPEDEFKRRLAADLFGAGAVEPSWVDDALTLNRAFFEGRTWCQPARLVSPGRLRTDLAAGRLGGEELAALRASLAEIDRVMARHASASNAGRVAIHRIAAWVADQWTAADRDLLQQPQRSAHPRA